MIEWLNSDVISAKNNTRNNLKSLYIKDPNKTGKRLAREKKSAGKTQLTLNQGLSLIRRPKLCSVKLCLPLIFH